MRNRFIIARHQENLKWTANLDGEVLVYNSGDLQESSFHGQEKNVIMKYIKGNTFFRFSDEKKPLEFGSDITFISVPNKGREASKWLKYLIDFYDNYQERNIFLQGYPFDHISWRNIHSTLSKSKTFGYIDEAASLENDFEHPRWTSINRRMKRGHDQKDIYQQIYGDQIPERFAWRYGAQFYVDKEILLKNKKSYYKFLQEILENFEEDGPYCFERSWLTFIVNSPEDYRT